MAPILTLHEITAGTGAGAKKYYCLLKPGIYKDADVKTATGIQEALPADYDQPPIPVGTLLQKGIVHRVRASGSKGTGLAAKRVTHNLLVENGKLGTVIDGLKGKTIDGVVMTSAGFVRRRFST